MGWRCHICTGCGACLAENSRGLDVVTARKEAAPAPFVYTQHTKGKRLVTADVGTTTIAMQLYGVDGAVEEQFVCVNPQVKYGADVLSRIQAAADGGAAGEMRALVRQKLAEGLELFQTCLGRGEALDMVLAGNTTMIYLLMGYAPAELGQAPFAASHLEAIEMEVAGVPCQVFPGLSAFVGGDIVAGMYASGMWEKQELTLLIDLGTNGELVLGNRGRRIACATAAGPAFEGGVNRGVWGADMVSLLANLRRRGIVDETGLLAEEYFDEGILIGNVRVTQESIRAVQLAKGAIGAGIRILMQEYGLRTDPGAVGGTDGLRTSSGAVDGTDGLRTGSGEVDGADGLRTDPGAVGGTDGLRTGSGEVGGTDGIPETDAYSGIAQVILAGGFGYYLNPADAACIGILPEGLVGRTKAGGNTALAGALRLGRDILRGGDAATLLAGRETEVLNLANHPDFERIYLDNMELRAYN